MAAKGFAAHVQVNKSHAGFAQIEKAVKLKKDFNS